ncbi:MAG TPA: aquaporin [Candidatus Saccharimonadales bacterium]|nr:aquaporin [Candidatus Saccharimonadales bacterium]
MFRKNKLAMLVSEFLGTASLTLMVLAISHSQLSLSFFVAIGAGLIVLIMTLALAGISGAVFNPAMTLGLWTVRKLRTLQALSYIVVQLAGGALAWWLFVYFTKLNGVHNTGTYSARVLVAEVVGTFIFAFAWASAIYQRFTLPAKAATIGIGLTTGALIASLGSAGVMNPAVALGLRQWGWGTYVLGPILGAVIGFNLYNLLFVETELAEVAESKDEKAKTSKLNATLTQSEVATEADATVSTAASKARTSSTVKSRTTTAKKKTAATAKRKSTSRRNPNAA